jgi:signal transduction histidine kinase
MKNIKKTIYLKLMLYTLLLVGIGLGLFLAASNISNNLFYDVQSNYLVRQLDKLKPQLAKEKYTEIRFPQAVFAKDSFLEVVTDSGYAVYSRSGTMTDLTPAELNFIGNAQQDSYAAAYSYLDQQRGKMISIATGDSEGTSSGIYIYDSNGTLVYSNQKDAPALNAAEVAFLEERQPNLVKYGFTTESGQTRYLIAEVSDSVHYGVDEAYRESSRVYIGMGLAYLVMILLYVSIVNRNIVRPLHALNTAIRRQSAAELEQEKRYKGTAEFQEIFDSYEDMLKNLDEEKKKRSRLEDERNEMLSDISHDLKTPITVIRGYTKALKDGVIEENERSQVYDTIDTKASYLGSLIDQFAEYSKLDHPQFHYDKKLVEIRELMREIMAEKYNEFTQAGIELSVDLDGEASYVLLDAVQFRRALYNVLDNAVKHCGSGARMHVCIRDEQPDTVRILLEDSGPGIPPDIRENLFDPFVVTDQSRSRSGSGLGLAICRKIIQDHHGAIVLAEPEKGYATCFEIRLPRSYKTVKNL